MKQRYPMLCTLIMVLILVAGDLLPQDHDLPSTEQSQKKMPVPPTASAFLPEVQGLQYESLSPSDDAVLLRWDFSSDKTYDYSYSEQNRFSSSRAKSQDPGPEHFKWSPTPYFESSKSAEIQVSGSGRGSFRSVLCGSFALFASEVVPGVLDCGTVSPSPFTREGVSRWASTRSFL